MNNNGGLKTNNIKNYDPKLGKKFFTIKETFKKENTKRIFLNQVVL